VTRPRGTGVRGGLAAATAAVVLSTAAGSSPPVEPGRWPQDTVAPHLRLQHVQIAERPPLEHRRLSERGVVFSLRLAGRPPCAPNRSSASYVFVLDARPWQPGRITIPLVPELRPTARLAVTCDPARGRFVASIPTASVTLRSDGDAAVLDIATTLRELPAVEFRWVALATDGEMVTRVPARGRAARWRIQERVVR
jgi:hypothetical protein